MRLEFYQKPTCTTCRKVKKELEDSCADFESINYYEIPLTKAALKALLKKLNLQPFEILRKKEPIYRELNLASREISADELLGLMAQYPDLIERPIVVKGNKAVLARPAEKVRELL
ncbi:MAG: arsenate reductase [Candidatus Omnitrophica bacterium]|nr:arsenate reductase [Candidatus Omnitrophota bacterium]